MMRPFPVIDPEATGANIKRLRLERKLSVVDLQIFFNFDTPRVIYKWQKGQCLPSVDNLYALSVLLEVDMAQILVCKPLSITMKEPQDKTCGSFFTVFSFWASSRSAPPPGLAPRGRRRGALYASQIKTAKDASCGVIPSAAERKVERSRGI